MLFRSETLQFDQQKMSVVRHTEPGGGKTETSASACAKDALAFLQFVRSELAQGRVATAQTVFLGAPYQTRVEFAGTQRIRVDGQSIEADKALVSIKGPASNLTIEVYFSKDAARTPVFARIPLSLAAFTVELMH